MSFFQRLIRKTTTGGQIAIFSAFLLNTVIISFFTMTIMGISSITNDKLSPNDMDQVTAAISSMALTGVITIVFLQWIVWSLYQALFEARSFFNKTMRMIGCSENKIFKIYLVEFLLLQITVLPFSLFLSYIFYNKVMAAYGFVSEIDLVAIGVSVLINLGTAFLAMYTKYKKNHYLLYEGSFNPQSQRKKICGKRLSQIIKGIKIIIGVAVMLCLIYLLFVEQSFYYASLLFILLTIIFWNELALSICTFISPIFPPKYHMISNLLIGHLKPIKIISCTIIFGMILVFSINAFISSSRHMAYNQVIENINYEVAIQSVDFFEEKAIGIDKKDMSTALLFVENTVGSSTLGIMAVDQRYLEEFERLEYKYNTIQNADEKMANGIIFPNHLVEVSDIGKTISLAINGQQVEFVIVDGYDVNDYSTMFAYVNKSYVEAAAGLSNQSNVIFLKDSSDAVHISRIEDMTIHTKKEIATESYNKVVKSTFVLEVTALIVLLVSFFMLANFIFLSAGKNKMDIARMRCVGMTKHKVHFTYIVIYILIIVSSTIPAAFGAYAFAKVLMHLMLDVEFGSIHIIFPWHIYMITIGIYIIYVVFIYFLVCGKTACKYINLIRIKVSAD